MSTSTADKAWRARSAYSTTSSSTRGSSSRSGQRQGERAEWVSSMRSEARSLFRSLTYEVLPAGAERPSYTAGLGYIQLRRRRGPCSRRSVNGPEGPANVLYTPLPPKPSPMWLLYAAAFVLGAGILLVQLLSGHHGHDVGGHDAVTDHHPSEGPGLMSIRSVSYGVFAFGFVGGTLHVLGLAAPNLALVLGLVAGGGATLAVGMTFRALGDPTVFGEAGFHEARGATGRVLVPCARGREGKVRVTLKGQTV